VRADLPRFRLFLQARKAADGEAMFEVRLAYPVSEFSAHRHVGDDSLAELPSPGSHCAADAPRIRDSSQRSPVADDQVGDRVRHRDQRRAMDTTPMPVCSARIRLISGSSAMSPS
jgi:hypothetical protein